MNNKKYSATKLLGLIAFSLVLTGCASTASERFAEFQHQVSANNRIDLVIDTFGLNDIKGKSPGFITEKNNEYSTNMQKAFMAFLKNKGYTPTILAATQGVHMMEVMENVTIKTVQEEKIMDENWQRPTVSTGASAWLEPDVATYLDTVFTEAQFYNLKTQSLLVESLTGPAEKNTEEYKRNRSPEGAAQRKKILNNMPTVIANSNADTIVFVKSAGYEANRAKAFAAATLSIAATVASGGATSSDWMSGGSGSHTDTHMVAVDRKSGQVIWTASLPKHPIRYSDAIHVVATLMQEYPKSD